MYGKEGKKSTAPDCNSAERHQGSTDRSMRGQQVHNPGSSGAQQEGGAVKMPTLGAPGTKLERRTGKEDERPRTGQNRQVRAQGE